MKTGVFTEAIYSYLKKTERTLSEALLTEGERRFRQAMKRQTMEEREDAPGVLRMSAGGKCARAQWYRFNGISGEPLTPRTHVTFLMGDICEIALSILGRLAGLQLLGKENADDREGDLITMQIPVATGRGEPAGEPFVVSGHIDDLLHDNETDETFLVEYKSMSEYSFRSFEKDIQDGKPLDDTWGYATQMSLYMKALGLKRGIMVAVCKNTGHIADRIVDLDESLVSLAKDRWHRILNVDETPEREHPTQPETRYNRSTKSYEPTGRNVLDIRCQYCAFKGACWRDRLTMEMKGERPVWVIQ